MDGGAHPGGFHQGAGAQGGAVADRKSQGRSDLLRGKGNAAAVFQRLRPVLRPLPGLPIQRGGAGRRKLFLLCQKCLIPLNFRVQRGSAGGQFLSLFHLSAGKGIVRLLNQVRPAVHGVHVFLSGRIFHCLPPINLIFSNSRRAFAVWRSSVFSGGLASPLAGAFPWATNSAYRCHSSAAVGRPTAASARMP